ncbi:MAG: oxidoreductase domain protein [Chitinophagaceae bacterium]|nr:oxidoreductase domain protein [Chitinophagaceae bacterium]
MNSRPRLAIIGAGALTEGIYLPVLKESQLFDVACLVDINTAQASRLAEQYHIPRVLHNVHDIHREEIDAALIVLPNFLHASVTMDLLEKGIHVLVEKPMANSSQECERMNAKAQEKGVKLAVGLVRRFYPTTIFLKEAIEHHFFGKLISFDFEEGHVFEWKLQSDYLLSKEKAGGGVLMDTGVHMLDQLIYCMGVPETITYYDDNKGGVEADCRLEVTMAGNVKGKVAFSRIRKMRNSMILQFQYGRIEVGLNAHSELMVHFSNGIEIRNPLLQHGKVMTTKGAFIAQLNDFVTAIVSDTPCKVSGEEGIVSVKILEQCYAHRKSIHAIQPAF